MPPRLLTVYTLVPHNLAMTVLIILGSSVTHATEVMELCFETGDGYTMTEPPEGYNAKVSEACS